jgi:acyl-CoA thioester hydrolase
VPFASPSLASEIDLRVRYAETDQMGVVYHSNYLVWCEVGRTELIRQLGRSYAEIERLGVGLAVADAALRFIAPARYDDLVRVTTTLAEVKSRAVVFHYVISHVERATRLVTASTTLVGVDKAGRIARLPAELQRLLNAADA